MAETTLYRALYSRLGSVSAVTDLVGSTGADEPRIRPFGKLKQNEVLPAIAISRIAARRWPTFGTSKYPHVDALAQVDSYGRTEDEALAVAEAVRNALQDWSGSTEAPRIRGTHLDTEQDFYEEETETFRVLQQYRIHHSE